MSFLAPFGLLLGLLAVPLAALYFLRLRRRKVAVSSLMLWHAVRRSEQLASPFQRFRRNLLLLLQLLALLLLVLAFARPYLQTEARLARAVVLVLDTSASMGATDGSAAGDTRFDQARAEARALLDELGPGDEAMIVSAGPVTEVVAPFTRDKGALSVALDGVRLTQAAASLEEGLRLALSLARTRPDVEVVVLSDGGPDDLSGLPAGEVDVRYLRTGTQATNAGIVALDLRRSPVSEAERQLFVTVQNQGDVANRGSVELFLDGELVGLRTERLDPSVPVAMVFDLPPLVTGVVEVKLSWPDDRLPADDTAYAVVARTAAHDVLLVGNDPLLARILASDHVGVIHFVHPAGRRLTNQLGAERLQVFIPLEQVALEITATQSPYAPAFFGFVLGLLDWAHGTLHHSLRPQFLTTGTSFLKRYLSQSLRQQLLQDRPADWQRATELFDLET